MKTLGVAVLGYGFMGKTHTYAYHTLPFYYDPLPAHCELKVICSSTPERAKAAQAAGGFERASTNLDEAINAEDVDIVHICTPNHLHLPALKAAMLAQKHIYVEKPVTATMAEAEEVARLLPQYKGYAQVVLQNRFFPATLKAKALVAQGFLGPVTQFRAAYLHAGSADPAAAVNWKSTAEAGGGVVRDLGVHILDLLDWLIGPFSSVCATSRIWSAQRPNAQRPGERLNISAEEAAVMLLKSAEGAIGTLEATKIATGVEDELRFEIHGRDGAIRFNLMDPNFLEVYDARQPDGELGGSRGWQRLSTVHRYPKPGGKFPGAKPTVGWLRGHVHSLFSFVQAIAENRQPEPSLAQGLYLQRMLEAILQSAQQQSWVQLPTRR